MKQLFSLSKSQKQIHTSIPKKNSSLQVSSSSFLSLSKITNKVLNFAKNSKNTVIASFVGCFMILTLLNLNQISAQAASVTMWKGQTADFIMEYSNIGDSTADSALLTVKIGDKLVVDTASFTDQYGDGRAFCINPTVFTTDKTIVGNWGSFIQYRPRSAESTDLTTCKGEKTPGVADLGIGTNGTAKKGYIRFKATLKADITDPIGTVLSPDTNQGVSSIIFADTTNTRINGTITQDQITIVAKPMPSSSSIVSSSMMSSSSVSLAPTRTNLAKPNSSATTGGDFDSNKAQLIYTSMTFDPNPGNIKKQIKITTSGLLDSGTSETLQNTTCETTLKGKNYQQAATGNVNNGICEITITGTLAPAEVGTFQAVTRVRGPNGDLFTKPENVNFINPNPTIVTIRTGGISEIITISTIAGLFGIIITYNLSRKQKLRY